MDIANGNDYTLTVAAGGGQVETLQECVIMIPAGNWPSAITTTTPPESPTRCQGVLRKSEGTLTIGGGSKYRTQYGYDLMGRAGSRGYRCGKHHFKHTYNAGGNPANDL